MISKLSRTALALAIAVPAMIVSVVVAAPAASANGPCYYQTTERAQVRENPSINSVERKTVPGGYVVSGPNWNGGFCGAIIGTDGRYWVPVDCLCATDHIGFIIANKLKSLINT